jgi:MerR family transcriptional regulator, light-induced transcriptional regulator
MLSAINPEIYRNYLSWLLAGERHQCSETVSRLINQGLPIRRLHVDLFQASLYEVGELWATNQISVATEHLATAVTEALLNELSPDIASEDRVRKIVVVAGIEPELHQVGGRIVADTFEMCGWDSFFIGSNVSPAALTRMVSETKPNLVALSLTMYFNLSGLLAAIETLRREFPTLPVIVGGRGFHTGGTEIANRYSEVSYIRTLDELDVYIREFCRDHAS